ncbi:serine/threonine protein kinase [Paenibacillus pinihumi]|uniref:serine/threonine protein kinase n=1 Tax=Paenibacillus pinihumi TaxID=669462 RepID=UPI00048A452B|nr:protein kinase [Paenibacillus pinihumi]
MTTSFDLRLARGTILYGKWHGGRYEVQRLLGEGANGKVFLVSHRGRSYALKVGADAADLQSEINVLRAITDTKSRSGEPFLVHVDDFTHYPGRDYCFYVMQYIQGSSMTEYLQREGSEWYSLLGVHLLRQLAELHQEGWVFGDLKLDNVLVSQYGRAHLIDYGGVTAIGKSVRQFTELYDRGYWSAGSRRADPAYDLFSLAVLLIQVMEDRRLAQLLKSRDRSVNALLALVKESVTLAPFGEWFGKALSGGFNSAREASAAWQSRYRTRSSARQRKKSGSRWLFRAFAVSVLMLAATAIWYLNV